MTLIDFTLSNARRFYSSMGNPLAVKGLIFSTSSKILFLQVAVIFRLVLSENKTTYELIHTMNIMHSE